jgi:hypothetical protein
MPRGSRGCQGCGPYDPTGTVIFFSPPRAATCLYVCLRRIFPMTIARYTFYTVWSTSRFSRTLCNGITIGYWSPFEVGS